MRYLCIKNFSKYQHYKNRRPPWIKLHAEVLTDYAFACLPDASKAHLMLLWVLASRTDNRIPYDLPWLTNQLQATGPVDIDLLVDHGFVEVKDDASRTLAARKQDAMPEVEREVEKEKASFAAGAAGSNGGKPEAKRETWITPFADAWLEQYGGDMAIASALKPLRKLVKAHGDAEALRRWRLYLAATDAQYASAARFAATWGKWNAPTVQQADACASERNRKWGHISARRAKADGPEWYARMEREARARGTHPIDYAYDHLREPAEPARVAS